jgi:hypothetical protein
MDVATFKSESALNRSAYDQQREQIRRDFAGKYVAMAGGKIVGGAETFDAARALIELLDVPPEYYLVFPADGEPDFGLVNDLVGSA